MQPRSSGLDARPFVAAGVYLAAMTGLIYIVGERQLGYGRDAAAWVLLAFMVALHLATGWVGRRVVLALLPLLAILLAVPGGYPDANRGGDPFPLWFSVAVTAPVGAVLIAAAALGARRKRRAHERSPHQR